MNLTRISAATLTLCLCLVSGCDKLPTDPSSPPQGGTGDGSGGNGGGNGTTLTSIGCFAGANQNSPTMCGVLSSLGLPIADQALAGEVSLQRAFWTSIPVRNVLVMNDCSVQSRNAKADPVTRDILFGYNMFHSLVAQHGNVLPVAGVLAHEWAHQAQFSFGWYTNPVRNMELEADAFSGYFMALAKGWAWQYMASYFQTVYSTGDYNFSSPGHHGTSEQRLAMARVGFDTAVQAASLGRPLGYFDLHSIFYASIARVGLAPASMRVPLDRDLEVIVERIEHGDAPAIAMGRSTGTSGVVPGDASARARLWPQR